MRVLIDTCVLYPTVMREVLLGMAGQGAFTPLWSARILEEWRRTVRAKFPEQIEAAGVEIALLQSRWPLAEVRVAPGDEDPLFLPDPDDRHVLAAAINGQADVLLTQNTRDFPSRVLANHTILRRDPDGFMMDFWAEDPSCVRRVCLAVHKQAQDMADQAISVRWLLKKARLPRLGKALGMVEPLD